MLNAVTPPAKPPTPPPTAPNTNYPPVVINPTGSPGPAVTVVGKSTDGKLLAYTNSTSCWITNYNIASYQWPNTWEKGSAKLFFDRYWTAGMSSSTNTITWEDTHYQIECFYTTGVGVLYRYLHHGTNFYQCYFTSDFLATNGTARAYFDLTDKPYQPVQFFRLEPR